MERTTIMRSTTRGVVAAVLLAGTVTLMASPAQGSWWDLLGKKETVSLTKVLEDPEAFKAVEVEFVIQFHETTGFFNPFFTRFTPERYVNFAAWGDGQALWMPEDFAASHPLFFVEKGTPMAKAILHAAPFTRFRVTGRVESTFMDRAWIAITELEEEGTSLTNTALGHIIAGDKFAAEDRHNAAIQHYLKAYADKNLPEPARAAVAARLGRSYVEVSKPLEAQKYLQDAVKLDPKDEASKELLDKVGARIAGTPGGTAPEPRMGPSDDSEKFETPVPEEEMEKDDTPPAPEGGTEDTSEKKPGDTEDPEKRLSGPR